MYIDVSSFKRDHRIGESATHPIAPVLARPALLLLLAWNDHAASSRLAGQPKIRTLECVQPPFLGLSYKPPITTSHNPFDSQPYAHSAFLLFAAPG